MEEVPNLINICSTNLIQVLTHMDFLKDLCVSFKWYFWQNKKKIKVGTEDPQLRQEVYWE